MIYLNFIFLGLAIYAFIYAHIRDKQSKKTVGKIDRMLDLAIEGNLREETFDESMLSKIESKFNRYLLDLSSSEVNLQEQKEKIEGLISDISHQTKTPIANISLYAELLKEDQSKEYIEEIIFQTNKLKFLVESLLKASRLETGIIKLNPNMNEINAVIEAIIRSVEGKSRERSIRVIYEENKKHYAFFDHKWTEEAIYNIVDNSIKYSKDNGEVKITILEYPLFLRIDITDKGMGISEDDMAKVFQRFYRSEAVNAIEGVGIGLYLSREIVQGQNGYIKVQSQVGKGSTFSIFLPRDKK